ncbi:MAG: hypothetical protein M0C28_23705 [Candidatus Moduliflexus flocculans]|nr:hypothetical protein [Candidatus Moduliflexus flocculans]
MDDRARGRDRGGKTGARGAARQHRSRLSHGLGADHGHGQGFLPPRPPRPRASTPTSSSCSRGRGSRRSIGPIPTFGALPAQALFPVGEGAYPAADPRARPV